jgi:hypothetical protein
MQDPIAIYTAIATIAAIVGGVFASLLSALVSARAMNRQAKVEESRMPIDTANANVNSATQVSSISLQQTSQLSMILTDCLNTRRAAEDSLLECRRSNGKKSLGLLLAVANLKEIMSDHAEQAAKMEPLCSFFVILQQKVQQVIADMEEANG